MRIPLRGATLNLTFLYLQLQLHYLLKIFIKVTRRDQIDELHCTLFFISLKFVSQKVLEVTFLHHLLISLNYSFFMYNISIYKKKLNTQRVSFWLSVSVRIEHLQHVRVQAFVAVTTN